MKEIIAFNVEMLREKYYFYMLGYVIPEFTSCILIDCEHYTDKILEQITLPKHFQLFSREGWNWSYHECDYTPFCLLLYTGRFGKRLGTLRHLAKKIRKELEEIQNPRQKEWYEDSSQVTLFKHALYGA